MQLIRAVALLALAGSSLPASALEIGSHLGSYHTNPDACREVKNRVCNNTNPGAYVIADDGWMVGGYYNSVRRPTVYAGRQWGLISHGRLSFEAAAVVATGYPALPLLPMVMPIASVQVARTWKVRMLYLPRVPRVNETHVLHLAIEHKAH